MTKQCFVIVADVRVTVSIVEIGVGNESSKCFHGEAYPK